MQRKYGVIGRFEREGYTSWGMVHVQGRHGNPAWSDGMYSVGYKDGSRMEREYARHGQPMLLWKWQYNPGAEADALPWAAPDYDDKDWPTKHVVRDTWSSIGHHLTMTDPPSGRSGRMAYRTTQRLPALPEGKRAYLWIGSTDGTAKVYVNGTLMPYSEEREAFGGYCRAAQFEITPALKKNLDFVSRVAQNRAATDTAVTTLAEAGVITDWPVTLSAPDQKRPVKGLYRIDEEKLNQLADESFLALRKSQALAIAYGQLLSMGNIQKLGKLAQDRDLKSPLPS